MMVKVPGKLMVAGEFAVLEPKQKLVVTAVNRFVYATIEPSKQNALSLTDFDLNQMRWEWQEDQILFGHEDERIHFVKNALKTTYRYLAEQDVEVYPVSLSIRSELDDASGIKYGLGSSAAVVTAVVRAVLTEFLSQDLENILVFKLASIAHVRTQGNGSGADIAASTYHGVLEYTSFQAEWLLKEMEQAPNLTTLLEKDWTYLAIQPIQFPSTVKMLVAWTGKAASTKHLVAEVKKLKNRTYEDFLIASNEALKWIISGMKTDNQELFFKGIRANRRALATLGDAAGVEIETAKLHALAMEAEKVSGAGKLSGAGGGDCGIVFMPVDRKAEILRAGWLEKGITPLDLEIYDA